MTNEIYKQIEKDMGFCKALVWLKKGEFRWCKCQLISGPNEYGQHVVKRIRNGFLGVTTQIKSLSQEDKDKVVENFGYKLT